MVIYNHVDCQLPMPHLSHDIQMEHKLDKEQALLTPHNLCHLQLGPWLAVEIPDMISRGVVTYKEKGSGDNTWHSFPTQKILCYFFFILRWIMDWIIFDPLSTCFSWEHSYIQSCTEGSASSVSPQGATLRGRRLTGIALQYTNANYAEFPEFQPN